MTVQQLTGLPKRLGLTGSDLLLWAIIVIFSVLIWWPSRYMPYFWDSSGFVINTARDTYLSKFSNIVSAHTDFAHPPLFTMALALFWTLFAESRLISHILMFPFLPILAISTYHFIKTYTRPPYAALGAALMALTPVALAEYVNIYIDLPSAAMAALSLLLYRTKHFNWGIICFTAAVMIKLPVLVLLPFLILTQTSLKQRFITGLVPIATVIIWLTFHYFQTGWLLIIPGRQVISIIDNPGTIISNLLVTLQVISVEQGRFTWLAIIVLALLICLKKPTDLLRIVRPYAPLLAASLTTIAFFIYAGEVAARYVLFFLPVLLTITMLSLSKLQRTLKLSQIGIAFIALILFSVQINYWRDNPTPTEGADFFPPDNLSIVDYVQSFREMTTTIEMLYPEATVYGGFPENVMLKEPYQGYVSKIISFFPCEQYQTTTPLPQIIVIHPYAPSQINCHQLLQQVENTHLAGFETNGKWVELYQVNQPPVSDTDQ